MRRLTAKTNPLILLHVAASGFLLLLFALQVSAEEAQKPGNVVSLGGSVTEIIFALGEEQRLIARDTTSVFPSQALELPDVGYIRALSPEGVLSVGPEMVIAEEGAGPSTAVDVLKASSIPYVEVPQVDTPAGVLQKITLVGKALGVPEKAAELAAEVEKDMAAAMDIVAAQPPGKRRVLFVLSTQGGRIMAGGQDTAADAIIGLSGGENVIQSFAGYKPVTEEAIAAAQPDVILMMARTGNHANTNAELWAMPALSQTPAARNDAVVRIGGLLLLGFGPRTPQAISDLHGALLGQS